MSGVERMGALMSGAGLVFGGSAMARKIDVYVDYFADARIMKVGRRLMWIFIP